MTTSVAFATGLLLLVGLSGCDACWVACQQDKVAIEVLSSSSVALVTAVRNEAKHSVTLMRN
jgi:hypothetical protein